MFIGIVMHEKTIDSLFDAAARNDTLAAADAVARSINDRRVEAVSGMLHRSVRLDFQASERSVRGRVMVLNHLRRLFRDLDENGPVALAAATAVMPFEGYDRYPCALLYDGPQRSFAICPRLTPDAPAGDRAATIESLTVLSEPALLATAERLDAPDFPDGLTAPAPLSR